MSITEKELQTFITKIGAKIQSMTDVSFSRASEFNKYASKLAELPESECRNETLQEYLTRRDIEIQHYEQLKELANMYNEFFVK